MPITGGIPVSGPRDRRSTGPPTRAESNGPMTRLVTHKTLAARLGVGVLAVGLVSLLVLTGSRAAFTDTTDNSGNTWEAGQVTLTDDDLGSAMFTTSGMVPGTTVEKCITVTYTGSTGTATPSVKLYGANGAQIALNPDLDLTIEHVTGDLGLGCSNMLLGTELFNSTVAAFTSGKADFTSGVDTWNPTTGQERVYRFTVTLGSDTADAQQGAQGSAGFTWEVQVSE